MSDKRSVAIELVVVMFVEVPDDWDIDQINFWLNESCHCLTNEVGTLCDEFDKLGECECMCNRLSAKYMSENQEWKEGTYNEPV